jgi:hypothetical protein
MTSYAILHWCALPCLWLALLLPSSTRVGAVVSKIPEDISAWHYGDAMVGERFWDLSALQRASAIINYDQMRPVFSKLQSGKPITVSALGDSIVADLGGCFARDVQHLEQQLPYSELTMKRRERCEMKPRNAWMYAFMRLVNATWPHKDHLLVNNGIPGMPFHSFASGRRRSAGQLGASKQ